MLYVWEYLFMNFKKIGIGLSAVIAVVVIISFLLPSSWNIEESITIDAKNSTVYPLVSNLKLWEKWSPWNKDMDPSAEYRFEGPEQGIGAHQFWDGKKIGKGNLLITESDEEKGIKYDLFFDNNTPSKGGLLFSKTDKGLEVVWTGSGSFGTNPLKRYIGLMMDKTITKDFKAGLSNLKSLAESLQAEADKLPPEVLPALEVAVDSEKPIEQAL